MPPSPTTIRLSDEDRRLLVELTTRLGLEVSGLVRLAIRRLHAAEFPAEKKIQKKGAKT